MLPLSKKAARGNGTAFRDVVSWHGCDTSENTKTLPEIQAEFLASKFGLGADRARLVASLVFQEVR